MVGVTFSRREDPDFIRAFSCQLCQLLCGLVSVPSWDNPRTPGDITRLGVIRPIPSSLSWLDRLRSGGSISKEEVVVAPPCLWPRGFSRSWAGSPAARECLLLLLTPGLEGCGSGMFRLFPNATGQG